MGSNEVEQPWAREAERKRVSREYAVAHDRLDALGIPRMDGSALDDDGSEAEGPRWYTLPERIDLLTRSLRSDEDG